FLAPGHVPQTNRVVFLSPGGQGFAVRRKGGSIVGPVQRPAEGSACTACGQVPPANRLVPAARNQPLAVPRKSDERNWPAVALRPVALLARGHIPEVYGTIPLPRTRGEGLAVRRERQPGDAEGMAGPVPEFLACGYLPQPNHLVAGA